MKIRISDATKDAIRARVDLQALAAELLGPGKSEGGAGIKFKCPFHDDGGHPNLDIRHARRFDGWKCYACHEAGDAFKLYMGATGADFPTAAAELAARAGVQLDGSTPPALLNRSKSAGKSPRKAPKVHREPWHPRELGAPVRVYSYTAEDGAELFRVYRYRQADGRKTFRQWARVADGWVATLADVRRVPYRLPALLAAVGDARPVFFVEGEKDADNIAAAGLAATTTAQGAASWQATRETAREALRGAHVVLVPDNDAPGRAFMQTVGADLLDVAASVRLLDPLPALPGYAPPEKSDASDWLEAGGTAAALEAAARACPLFQAAPLSPLQPPSPPGAGSNAAQPGTPFDANAPIPVDRRLRYTDTSNAAKLRELHGGDLRYVDAWGKWLAWDGQRWIQDGKGRVRFLARNIARAWLRDAADMMRQAADGDGASREAEQEEAERAIKWARKSASRAGIEAAVALAQSEPGIPILHTELDADPWLLNVNNGTVDLRTGELRPHDRGNLCTKLAPVDFDPAAACPTWDRFLLDIMCDDPELVTFLQRSVGYSLTGDVSEQCMFFLHGGGSNGKSTFLDALLAALGDYACPTAPDVLIATNQERHPAEVADLFGARLVTSVEADEGRRFAEAKLKQLTGGDRLKARLMRQDFFDFAPTHKVWLCANHKPIVRGTDAAIWRRIRLIPFLASFYSPDDPAAPPDARPKDTTLPARLRRELPGILAWAVRGCLDWQRQGLTIPAAVRQATASYREEMDTFGRFLSEECFLGPQAEAFTGALFRAYGEWAAGRNERPMSARAFGQKLAERGLKQRKSHGLIVWQGIGLRVKEERRGEEGEEGERVSGSSPDPSSYAGEPGFRSPSSPSSPRSPLRIIGGEV